MKKESDTYECPTHGEVKDYNARATIGGNLSDGSTEINFRAYDKNAERLIALSIDDILKKSRTVGAETFTKKIETELIGRLFVFRGTVRASNRTGKLTMTISSIDDIDFEKETNQVLQDIYAQLQVQGK